MKIVWYIAQIVVAVHFVLPFICWGAYQISRLVRYHGKRRKQSLKTPRDYAIIVTAYEQIELLPDTVTALLKLNYQNYIIYVVADNCDVSQLNFHDPKVVVLRPPVVLGNNVRSHLYAINHFQRYHEVLTIIDSDNIVDPDYLNRMNESFDLGCRAVQGTRKPRNLDSLFACLDAARDIYYHFYDGKVLYGLGSSATLAGSGMAFDTELYLDALKGYDFSGAGFDKVLQYGIVRKGERIAFAEDAIVFDAKTNSSSQLVAQRSRWINTWFRYWFYGLRLIPISIWRLDFNQLLFGIILLRPPLFLFLVMGIGMLLINIIIGSFYGIIAWLCLFGVFILSFFLALFSSSVDKRITRSMKYIPVFVFYQIVSLFNAKRAHKISIATKHKVENNIE